MRGVFDEEEDGPAKARRDTELTLGTGMQLLLVFGLLLLCGVCFGLGYFAGHRGAQPATLPDQPATGTQPAMQAGGSLSKPTATEQAAATPTTQNAPQQSDSAQPGSSPAQAAPAVAAARQGSNPVSPASQPMVRPALPPAVNVPLAASTSDVQPAAQLTVQIAAVSHQEDADVLIGALRKHGYAVSAHRDPADNLIHVRIGPFNDRDEANRWRLKLLNDGYNAMIQP
jgi:cell division septation protein DedD